MTAWTVFTAEDASAVDIDAETAEGRVLRRGRHIIVARYLDQVVPIEVLVPLSEGPVDLSKAERRNFIDDHILDLLATLRLPLSPPAADATYLRRLTLDLTGRLPEPDDVRDFLNHAGAGKREKLVSGLLRSDAFTEYWTLQLAKLLRRETRR